MTTNQSQALTDLRKYGSLVNDDLKGGFSHPQTSAVHSSAAVQQLVSDGLAFPSDFVDSGLGFRIFTKVLPRSQCSLFQTSNI
jgi:hypothetical protein